MLDHRETKGETEAPPAPAPSSRHRAYVGPGERYDLMGATQFALLHALGLREPHKLLDFGCGSLRAGRLLIPYLGRGRYHGVEPNQWLVEAAIEHEIGRDLMTLKSPHLHTRDDFRADRCGTDFDFILAQSIFSHTGLDLMMVGLAGFRDALAPSGLVAATFIHADDDGAPEPPTWGWIYPGVVRYAPDRLQHVFQQIGLHGRRIPWFHPNRQTWYVLARDKALLPDASFDHCLTGGIWRNPAFKSSVQTGRTEADVAGHAKHE